MFSRGWEKKWLLNVIFITGVFFIVVLSWENAGAVRKISLATTESGSTWYMTGGLWANLCNSKIPGIQITPEITSGSQENARLLDAKRVEICYLNGLAAYWAWNGEKPYYDHKISALRSLFYIHGSTGHIVVLKKSNLRTWVDLKDKRIEVGSPTGNQEVYTRAIFKEYGFSDEEIKKMEKNWVFMSQSVGLSSLKDGRLDAVQIYGGMPNSNVMDIATTHDIDLIGLTKDIQKRLVEKYPYFWGETVPANTYKGVDKDVLVISSTGIICADKDLPEDIVYNIVKEVSTNIDQLAKGHRAFKTWKFIPEVGNLIPLHEGAKRYYKEKGLMK